MSNWAKAGRVLTFIGSILQFIGGGGTVLMGVMALITGETMIAFIQILLGGLYLLIGASLWWFVKYFDSLEIED